MAAPASPAMAAVGRGAMSSDNAKGLVLAVSSSAFIGASFIVKKMGLRRAADSGVRAGYGGFSYLMEPLWWIGMISNDLLCTVIVGEIANFAAYAFAPAILVTPLGALSIIISAALAHVILQEKLHTFGILGCVLCVVGSITIVLHAPQERAIDSVKEVWDLATEPAFLCYAAIVVAAALVLIYYVVPDHGQTNIMVYIGVCSLLGSLTALDTFNTAVVSPIYYVMFTSLTIIASVIMFKVKAYMKINFTMKGTGQSLSSRHLRRAGQNGFSIEVVPLKFQDSVDDETLALSLPKADNGYLKEGKPLRYKDLNIV
ncbi:hypothetical protein PR202_gb16862 [Eleusine coracana subsp. coracana]|uniref:Probable magnesium transporter n=1 Tax=Eleusine coracana subsp. coracana TaxID=191504 RepID=A0AAV5F2K2_ELECO|nr:hypothetical protein PR202_gb16862 [Eleusine coracana subsp. coracana]